MKYLKSFVGLIKESNRFLNFKEVLDTIEDLSLDFTDEGGEVIFGIMPSQDIHYANFDQNLNDIDIKMASMGKRSVYVKFDIQNIKKSSGIGKLSEESLEIVIDTITSVHNYLVGEGMVVQNFWTKEIVARRRSDYGKNEFFSYKTIDELLNSVDVIRAEKLGQLVSQAGIRMKADDISFRSLLDVRIVFTGQPLLEESTYFKVKVGLQATESDYESLKEIIDDFNQNNFEGDNKNFEVVIHSVLFGRPVRADFGQGQKRAYLVMVHDNNRSYSGFQISDVSELLLRLMSEFGSESIWIGIVFIGDPERKNVNLTKDDLLNNKPMDPISNFSFYIEIVT
jgi:hypothetical protein